MPRKSGMPGGRPVSGSTFTCGLLAGAATGAVDWAAAIPVRQTKAIATHALQRLGIESKDEHWAVIGSNVLRPPPRTTRIFSHCDDCLSPRVVVTVRPTSSL